MAASSSSEWLIEIGHSRLKMARYGLDANAQTIAMSLEAFAKGLESGQAFVDKPKPERVWLCAVPETSVLTPALSAMRNAGIEYRRVTTGSVRLPVQPAYAGLGVDRWLALQPPWRQYQSAFVMIDAGTATTIDVVNEHGDHQGGWILPGRAAARHGLIAFTPGLERSGLYTADDLFTQAASDTFDAIERGLILQQIGAIELALNSLQQTDTSPVPLVLTGGDAPAIGTALEIFRQTSELRGQNTSRPATSALESRVQPIWTAPDLVLQGLGMAADELR